MILIDANVLFYAYDGVSSHHAKARDWLDAALSHEPAVRFSWTTLLAFIRIATNPRAAERPLSTAQAAAIVASWLAVPSVGVLSPTARHWSILCDLLDKGQARGNLVMDAHLAALAIEHGATLCTTDRDFLRFPGLKIENPIEAVGLSHP
jgi:uncharacterized protein